VLTALVAICTLASCALVGPRDLAIAPYITYDNNRNVEPNVFVQLKKKIRYTIALPPPLIQSV
jgi:hypothetical protein